MTAWNLRSRAFHVFDRAAAARISGTDQVFAWRVQVLERVDDTLDRLDEVPAVGRLASAFATLVERRLEAMSDVPVEGWADLNAKKAILAVRELDRAGLRAARLHESRHKERKTVLAAIDGALAA